MPTVLAGKHRTGVSHDAFHIAMAVLGAHTRAAIFGNHLAHRTRGDEVVQNCRTGFATQKHFRQNCRRRAARHGATKLVNQKHTVSIAVKCQTHVKTASQHAGLQIALIGRLNGVGWMIGKRAVQLAIHDLEINHVEPLEHRWHH